LLWNCNFWPGTGCYSVAMQSRERPRSGFGPAARRAAAACAVSFFTVALFWACGGTTGHQGDAPLTTNAGQDATVITDAGLGVDAEYDAKLFDVNIAYAPAPDVAAPPEGGAATGDGGYPNCPPWLPIDDTGRLLDASDPNSFLINATYVPAYYTDADGSVAAAVVYNADGVVYLPPDGGVVLGPDGGAVYTKDGGVTYTGDGGPEPLAAGGACATYPWFPQFDTDCVNYQYASDSPYPPYPPCNWAIGLGNAQAGPMSGISRYALCMALYSCIQSSSCWAPGNGYTKSGLDGCFCGAYNDAGQEGCQLTPPQPTGACATAIQAAFETPDLGPTSVKAILANYTVYFDPAFGDKNLGLSAPSYGAGLLNVYALALANRCVVQTPATDAGAAP
jgi:hypothetical protein